MIIIKDWTLMKRLYTLCAIVWLTCLSAVAQTSLPKVYLYYTDFDKDVFNPGVFYLEDGTSKSKFRMEVRHRGDLSSTFDKPSYAIKLYDHNFKKVDVSLLGLREDNYWILDAMAADMGRVRNRVTMDLWLEYSRKPWYADQEPKMINGYRGKMVELYVDNVFQGLYCLNERMDRKQLKLKKYSEKKGVQGVMYKSTANTRSSMFLFNNQVLPDEENVTWDGWTVKYPDLEDGDPITWEPMLELIKFVDTSTSEEFSERIGEYVDMPVLIDYLLLCELISGSDNIRKNMIVSFYHEASDKALLTPWDLDISWGRNYIGAEVSASTQVYDKSNLFCRLLDCAWFVEELQARWSELRQSYFTIEHIDELFGRYYDLYEETGVGKLEKKLWNGVGGLVVDMGRDRKYVHTWTMRHLAYLDHFFYGLSHTTGTNKPSADGQGCVDEVRKTVVDGRIVVIRNGEMWDMWGRKL